MIKKKANIKAKAKVKPQVAAKKPALGKKLEARKTKVRQGIMLSR